MKSVLVFYTFALKMYNIAVRVGSTTPKVILCITAAGWRFQLGEQQTRRNMGRREREEQKRFVPKWLAWGDNTLCCSSVGMLCLSPSGCPAACCSCGAACLRVFLELSRCLTSSLAGAVAAGAANVSSSGSGSGA